jgi:hypothetical protein
MLLPPRTVWTVFLVAYLLLVAVGWLGFYAFPDKRVLVLPANIVVTVITAYVGLQRYRMR